MKAITRCCLVVLLLSMGSGCDSSSPSKSNSAYPEAEARGVNSAALESVVATLNNISEMRSLLVARQGHVILEEYFHGHSADIPLDVRSVTKSVMSTLTGIALDRGLIDSVGVPVAPLLDDFVTGVSQAHESITLKDILTMSSGISWSEDISNEYSPWIQAADQIDYVFQQPVIHTPGSYFVYNSGASHLLSPILHRRVGHVLEFANEVLFEPLGGQLQQWTVVSDNQNNGAAGCYLTARDMWKLGELYLNGGQFNGQQVVSQAWVQAATSVQVSTRSTIPYASGYGYLWWVGDDTGPACFFANGYGGQFIVVVPSLELVVVSQCEWRISGSSAGSNWYSIISQIMDVVIPAVD